MNQPLVSVIVPTTNSSRFLGECLEIKSSLAVAYFRILTAMCLRSMMGVLKPPTLLLPESGGFFSSKVTIAPL